jgi:Bacterial lipocalin
MNRMIHWQRKKKKDNNSLLLGVGITLALGAGVALYLKNRRTIPKGIKAVRPFDLSKYLGKWYEIARLDFMFEKNIDYATAEYSRNEDGTIRVVNRGYNYRKQEEVENIGEAIPVGEENEGMLKVSFCKPFYTGYNVIAIDNKYKYALVAGRNHNYLWILSKEKEIPEKIVNEYLEKAESLGFDISRLIWTKYK